MRYLFILLSVLFLPMTAAHAEVSVSIGINMPRYPTLVRVPGYPVYYDPRVDTNYFFYDGLYWVLQGDDWYASSWYNGPWERVDRYDVPLYVLRVPVRYYRQPPSYFRGWRVDAAPHWGRDWEQHRSGWDHWNRRAAPPPAPLPTYQRNYSGDRYPHEVEQQHTIRSEKYRYQPREPVTEQYFQQRQQQKRQHQQDQQRVEERRQQDQQQRQQQDQQRRQERRHQDEQRQQDQQRVQEQRQHQDQQRSQPASQDREQKRKDVPNDHGRDRNRDGERDQNR